MRHHMLFLRSHVTKYVLFLVGRVGSTYVTSVLSSHPQILAFSEELADVQERGAQAQLETARRLLCPPIIGTKKVRGFSAKLVHLTDPVGLARVLQDEHCKIIYMLRLNRVKSVISRLNAQRMRDATGKFGLFEEADRLPPLRVDWRQFDEYLKHRERVDADLESYVKALDLPTTTIHYEDVLRDESAVFRRLFSFLEVDDMPVRGRTLKITRDNLRESLNNFDEIRSRYSGTEYEAMFDEVLDGGAGEWRGTGDALRQGGTLRALVG